MNKDKGFIRFGIVVVLWVCLVLLINTQAKAETNYNFPYASITMDVVKQSQTGGGTYVCPSVQACYIYVLQAEARGATQYCESITIKRGGRTVWQRQYNSNLGVQW